MKSPCKLLLLLLLAMLLFATTLCTPLGRPEAGKDDMIQIPQWHCMRYRKFELVKRCRSYKHNGSRRL